MMKRRELLHEAFLAGTTAASMAALFATDSRAAGWAATEFRATESERKRTTRFAHFTDVHVQAKRSASEGLAQAIQHVHALDDQPEFILNGGDAIYDALAVEREQAAKQWSLWRDSWKQHGRLPVHNCLGNHDIWGWDKPKSGTRGDEPGWGKQLALQALEMQQAYYAFDRGGWRFLVLDSLTFDAETVYRAELDEAQFAWLRSQLEDAGQVPVVIVSHIPILTVGTVGFTQELRQHPQASRMLSHRDGFEILMLLRQFPNVRLCLSGHTHLTERVEFAGIGFVNSGAVSGLWWKGDFLHTDEGYNLIDLYDDGSFQTEYISYGWNAQGEGGR